MLGQFLRIIEKGILFPVRHTLFSQSLQVLFEERMRVLADHSKQLHESRRELSSSVQSER